MIVFQGREVAGKAPPGPPVYDQTSNRKEKNMYNVILVDDDLWIMEEIRTMMEGANAAYHVIQAASGARAVLEGGLLARADMVITDINMPEMDGLELIRRIRAAGYVMPILILSNYNDFLRVREALRLGASDYLLKQEITAETFRSMLSAPYMTGRQENPETEKNQKMWLRIIRGEEAGESARKLVGQHVGGYCVLLLQAFDEPLRMTEEDFHQATEKVWQDMKQSIFLPVDDKRAVVIVFSGDSSRYAAANAAWKMAQEVSARLKSRAQDVFAVISRPDDALGKIGEHYAEAVQGLDNRFYMQTNRVLDLTTARPFGKQEAKVVLEGAGQAVLSAMESKSREGFLHAFDLLMKEIREKKPVPADVRAFMAGLMLGGAFVMKKNGEMVGEEPAVEEAACLEDYRHWAGRMADALDGLEKLRKYGSIYKAVQLIEQAYGQPITLNDAADACGFSRNYFSNLFTATFGESFVQYLLRIRMEKAAELLGSTEMSIAAVAETVGMEYQPFCRRFRQYYHATPTDYRREGGVK